VTIANKLTLLRLALVPAFMVFMVFDGFWPRVIALGVFIAACITDLYDGKIARRTGTVTVVGTFLDPLVDKMLIAAALVAFVQLPEIHIPAWMVVLIISREFLITGLRSLAASRGMVLAAEGAGKFKMASQITAIILIFVILILNASFTRWPQCFPSGDVDWPRALHEVLERAPYWLVFWVTMLTILSGYFYLRKYADLLKTEFSMLKSRPK
jgi:CDP-diacylglycerol---glycerol-3-phosphate 3-phosphatidyltransferase